MLWRGPDEPWRSKSRHAVLGHWRELKLMQWDQSHGRCEMATRRDENDKYFRDYSPAERDAKILAHLEKWGPKKFSELLGPAAGGDDRALDCCLQRLRRANKVRFEKGRWASLSLGGGKGGGPP